MSRVALFVTCVVDQLFPETGVAAVRLLEAAGADVEFPEAQTCCGQPALSGGEPEAAAKLARHALDVLGGYDAVVAPSGSCAAMVRHWYHRLVPDRHDEADALAARTYELTQYLVDVLGVVDVGARVSGTVTVHDACHGLRNLGVADAPRALLRNAGATVVEMPESETCCGFGGVFATVHGEISGPLADDKLAHAATTNADWLVSGDAACLMHLEGRRRRTHVGPRPIHVAELLASGLP
ncbi:MAG: L-lactate dehydrogenase complex protein LldE [Actinomycetota bacterium]|nr:L-lactate dehydrogenase complex protein LldE [Actinomycetota bacterium]